mmetsp:Transcript_33617/g.106730  ORF Transcript_33617/g.106730 Transcript_33617/m.106730 type:complete len:220 (+) Transcript_33617:1044-1703(+)
MRPSSAAQRDSARTSAAPTPLSSPDTPGRATSWSRWRASKTPMGKGRSRTNAMARGALESSPSRCKAKTRKSTGLLTCSVSPRRPLKSGRPASSSFCCMAMTVRRRQNSTLESWPRALYFHLSSHASTTARCSGSGHSTSQHRCSRCSNSFTFLASRSSQAAPCSTAVAFSRPRRSLGGLRPGRPAASLADPCRLQGLPEPSAWCLARHSSREAVHARA